MRLRSSAEAAPQPAISAIVRAQPMQKPVGASIRQILTQGVS